MNLFKESDCFSTGQVWLDNNSKPIQAHGGCVIFHNSTYYWYGEDKSGETISGENIICGYRMDVIGIHCYSSQDLYNWRDEGLVLAAEKENTHHDLFTGKVVERPKVIFNEKTGLFVMWLHIDSSDYTYAATGVAVAENPTGPFIYMGSKRPNDNDSRDMTVFKDDDGKAYLLHSSEWNKTLYISELTDDYLGFTGKYSRHFIDCSREAPVVFKYENRYFLVTSGCTGWDPNEAQYAVAASLDGPWIVKGNPCHGTDADKTFYAQSTFAFRTQVREDGFAFMFDRWKKENLSDSSYIWLPVFIDDEKLKIEWQASWDLSVFIK